MKKKYLILAGAFLIVLVAFIFLSSRCATANEIKIYSLVRKNAFYYGKSYCPAVWKLKKADLNSVKSMPDRDKVEILSEKEDKELEKLLSEKYLGYNKYNAGDGGNKFYIYETICKTCELK